MDILRALNSINMDIRKKTLDIALDLITSRNIDEVSLNPKLETFCNSCGRELSIYIVDRLCFL